MNRLKKTLLYTLLSTLATVWGCREDVEEFRPYTPAQEDLGQLFVQAPGASTHTVFPFGGSIPDTTLTTASGVRVFLADTENLFADDAGTPVPCSTCPDLKITVTTALSKGDLMARRLPTISTPGGQMLESVGVAHVQATCNGKNLTLLPNRYIKIQLPAPEVKSGMEVYTGALDGQNKLTGWNSTTTTAFWAEWPIGGGVQQTGYELIAHLGWSNCARPVNEQTATFCVTLPAQFSALNTRAFLVFDNIRSVAEMKGDDNSSEFCFEAAPIGYPVKIVVVSKTGGQYWLVQKPWELGQSTNLSISPQPMSDKDVLAFIKSL